MSFTVRLDVSQFSSSATIATFPFDRVQVATPEKDSASSYSVTNLSNPFDIGSDVKEEEIGKKKKRKKGEPTEEKKIEDNFYY